MPVLNSQAGRRGVGGPRLTLRRSSMPRGLRCGYPSHYTGESSCAPNRKAGPSVMSSAASSQAMRPGILLARMRPRPRPERMQSGALREPRPHRRRARRPARTRAQSRCKPRTTAQERQHEGPGNDPSAIVQGVYAGDSWSDGPAPGSGGTPAAPNSSRTVCSAGCPSTNPIVRRPWAYTIGSRPAG